MPKDIKTDAGIKEASAAPTPSIHEHGPEPAAHDAAPVGKITEVMGEAQIVRADGTHVTAIVGTPVYQGDVIETSKTGAVNILFADNTTFAISESAKMSVDQFVYHSADHSGSTFFSMLQGVFVYTSGLIGKEDPGNVHIETPVGSIGIRGTVVTGHILPAGQQSTITILDGAVTLTNSTGTQEINSTLATVSLASYQSQPEFIHMDAKTFTETYHSVSGVANDTLSHFSSALTPAPATTAPAEHSTAPAEGITAPPAVAPAPQDAAPHANIAPPAAPVMAVMPTALPSAPPSASSFNSPVNTAAPDTYAMHQPVTTTPPPAVQPPPTNIPTAPPFMLNFNFSSGYTDTSFVGGPGVGEFANGAIIGTVTHNNAAAGPLTYSVTVVNPVHEIIPDNNTAGSFTLSGTAPAGAFAIDPVTGNLYASDPLLLSHFANPGGIDLVITATDSTGHTTSLSEHIAIRDYMPGLSPHVAGTYAGSLMGSAGPDFLVSDLAGSNTLIGGGGPDVLIGGSGNNVIGVTDGAFKLIDGGGGYDKLQLSNATTGVTLDFTLLPTGNVRNIEEINLGLSGGSNGSDIKLNIQDVFAMTDENHTLTITANAGAMNSSVIVDTNNFSLTAGSLTSTPTDLTYTGSYHGSTVTLVIQGGMNVSPSTGHIQVTQV